MKSLLITIYLFWESIKVTFENLSGIAKRKEDEFFKDL